MKIDLCVNCPSIIVGSIIGSAMYIPVSYALGSVGATAEALETIGTGAVFGVGERVYHATQS